VQVLLDDYGSAAAVATELVNTAPEVAVSTGDGLPDPESLHRFLTRNTIALQAMAGARRPTAGDLAAVHRLRGRIRGLIDSDDAGAAAAGAGDLLSAVACGPTLVPDAGRWRWQLRSRPRASVADELAVLLGAGLLSVIHVLGHERFRQCASPACRGVFVDTSRGGRRRYCVPEVCGNRINVANHRARRRAGRP
jgi:predicted RNA-binding Zn ribbon-like protein